MQYYTFELDKENQDLCTIFTPFVKYKYARLMMEFKCTPDIAQSIMENVLSGINDADVTSVTLVHSPKIGTTLFNSCPISCVACMRMDMPHIH